MEIFDYLNAITETKENLDFNSDEVKKDYSNYMINRFISMAEVYVPIVNEVNKFDLPKDTHFRYYQSVMPKRKQFFKYLKKKKEVTDVETQVIANYFEVGLKDAKRYIEMLDETQTQEILNKFRYGKNKQFAGI